MGAYTDLCNSANSGRTGDTRASWLICRMTMDELGLSSARVILALDWTSGSVRLQILANTPPIIFALRV